MHLTFSDQTCFFFSTPLFLPSLDVLIFLVTSASNVLTSVLKHIFTIFLKPCAIKGSVYHYQQIFDNSKTIYNSDENETGIFCLFICALSLY